MRSYASRIRIPEFKSRGLSQAIQEAAPVFDEYQERLNNVSNDIRAIETYLRSSGVSLSFSMQIEHPHLGDQGHRLSWEEYPSPGEDFRLVYTFNDPEADWSEGERRPLIEAKVSARLEVAAYLTEFIQRFAEHVRDRQPVLDHDLLANDDEVPF